MWVNMCIKPYKLNMLVLVSVYFICNLGVCHMGVCHMSVCHMGVCHMGVCHMAYVTCISYKCITPSSTSVIYKIYTCNTPVGLHM